MRAGRRQPARLAGGAPSADGLTAARRGLAAAAAEAPAANKRGPSFRAGLEAQIVMAAIERSAATGETVSIEPV